MYQNEFLYFILYPSFYIHFFVCRNQTVLGLIYFLCGLLSYIFVNDFVPLDSLSLCIRVHYIVVSSDTEDVYFLREKEIYFYRYCIKGGRLKMQEETI